MYRYSDTLELDAPLAELQMTSSVLTDGSAVLVQDVVVEQLDNYLRVLISGYDEWIVPTDDQPLTRSQLTVGFSRQAGMFNAQELKWLPAATATPVRRVAIQPWMSSDSVWGWVGDEPAGTTITVTGDADPFDATSQRPQVMFGPAAGPPPEQRPVLYRVHQSI